MRMKICRIESATLHKSFFLINPFKLGYTDIKRHGVKQNPFSKEMRPGGGSLCTCDKTNAFECCREVTALQRHFGEVNTGPTDSTCNFTGPQNLRTTLGM